MAKPLLSFLREIAIESKRCHDFMMAEAISFVSKKKTKREKHSIQSKCQFHGLPILLVLKSFIFVRIKEAQFVSIYRSPN